MSDEKLRYRPFVHKAYWFVLVGLILSELIVIRWNIDKIMVEESFLGAFIKVVVLSSVILSIGFRWIFVIRRRVFSEYQVLEEKIFIYFKSKVKEISIENIDKVEFSILPPLFFGGFAIVLKTGQKFYFLSLLKGNERILKSVFQRNSKLLADKDYKSYMSKSQMVEVSWERIMAEVSGKWLYLKYLVVNLFSGLAFYQCGYWDMGILNILLIVIIYAFFLGIIIRVLKENQVIQLYSNQIEMGSVIIRDLQKEKKIDLVFDIVFLALSALLLLGCLMFKNNF